MNSPVFVFIVILCILSILLLFIVGVARRRHGQDLSAGWAKQVTIKGRKRRNTRLEGLVFCLFALLISILFVTGVSPTLRDWRTLALLKEIGEPTQARIISIAISKSGPDLVYEYAVEHNGAQATLQQSEELPHILVTELVQSGASTIPILYAPTNPSIAHTNLPLDTAELFVRGMAALAAGIFISLFASAGLIALLESLAPERSTYLYWGVLALPFAVICASIWIVSTP